MEQVFCIQERDQMKDILVRMHRDTVTIFNKVIDGLYEKEIWYPTRIEHVGMEIDQQQNINKTGADTDDRCNLIIPLYSPGKKFVEPKVFRQMADEQRREHWTLKKDDFFVKGDLSDIDTNHSNLFDWVSDQYGEYSVFKITTIGDLTGKCLPKWKVGGK